MRSTLRFEKRQIVDNYLFHHPCIDCKEDDVLVLEFDHTNGIKIKNVSSMIHDNSSIQQLIDEIDKCIVRCANCHRRRHRLEERGIEV